MTLQAEYPLAHNMHPKVSRGIQINPGLEKPADIIKGLRHPIDD